MAEFTFLKLQLDNASFPANAPLVNKTGSDDEHDWESEIDEESRSILPLLVGFVFLVALAFGVKKLVGGSEDVAVEVDVAE